MRRFCGRLCLADWSGLLQSFLCVCDSSEVEWFRPPCCQILELSILQLLKTDQTELMCLGRELRWEFTGGSSTGSVDLWRIPVFVCGILLVWPGNWHHAWHLWALVLGCVWAGLWWEPRSCAAVSGGVPGVHPYCRAGETFSLHQGFISELEKKIKKRQLNLSLCFLTLWDFFVLCRDWGFLSWMQKI